MNTKTTIPRIRFSDSAAVSLKRILSEIDGENMLWSIVDLEAMGNLAPQDSMLDLESRISDSDSGMSIDWNELVRFSHQADQIINLNLVGRQASADFQSAADITIELIDSNVWEIQARDSGLVSRLGLRFS